MKIHHIGYLIKNIEKALNEFITFGYNIMIPITYDQYRDIDICFIEKDGYLVELISPKSEKSVVANLLNKIGNMPYHLCYISDNMDKDINQLRERGWLVLGGGIAPSPVISDTSSVIFLFHNDIGIIELLKPA